MFARLTTRDCPVCDTGHGVCLTRIMLGEGRCCDSHRHDRRQVVTAEWPDAPTRPPQPPKQPPGTAASDDERVVQSLLDRAEADKDEVEHYNTPSISAYRSLAASRGVDLETVIRHAVRSELQHIVALPSVQPGTNETPGDDPK